MTAIEWTDRTWNPVTGCTKVSEGCRHCYAEVMAKRTFGRLYADVPSEHGEGGHFRTRRFTDVHCHDDRLDAPLHWRKPSRVFVNSMSDLFHPDVPDEFIDRVFAVMALTPQHTYQVLTKRPERMRAYMESRTRPESFHWRMHAILDNAESQTPTPDVPKPLPNVWLGTSIEDQPTADKRIPELLATQAGVRFVSYEPALGPVDFERGGWSFLEPLRPPPGNKRGWERGLDWVIVGGESGPKARPCNVAWIRSSVEQCKAAGVPCFVKQLGANVRDRNDAGFSGDFDGSGTAWPVQHEIDDRIESNLDGTRDGYQGAPVRIHCRHPKGGDPAEWPEDLRVREWPEVRS